VALPATNLKSIEYGEKEEYYMRVACMFRSPNSISQFVPFIPLVPGSGANCQRYKPTIDRNNDRCEINRPKGNLEEG